MASALISAVLWTVIPGAFAVRDFAGTEVREGSEPNACAAIIAMCRARCTKDKDGGSEFVQMTIKLLNSATTCTTNETNRGELVPVNPYNENRGIVMFNIPCCQQDNLSKPCPLPPTLRSDRIPLTTRPLPQRDPSFPLRKDTTDATVPVRWCEYTDAVLLTFVILSFVLIALILVILILKSRKQFKKAKIAKSQPEEMQSVDNIAEATLVTKQENGWKQPANVSKVAENHHIQLSDNINDVYSGSETSTPITKNALPPSDYVVLDNQAFMTPPKSARPSRSRQQPQSEEILIVGGKNNPSPPPYGTQSSTISGFSSVYATDAIANAKISTNIQRADNMQNDTGSYGKQVPLKNLGAFGTTGRLDGKSKKQMPPNIYEDQASRNRSTSEVKYNTQNDSIYNRLRTDKEQDNFSDYQRLQRMSQGIYDTALPGGESMIESKSIRNAEMSDMDGNYVKDFTVVGRNGPTSNYYVNEEVKD